MRKKPDVSLPLIVKIAVILTFFKSWVLFEETVVDRHGLWQYMPFYLVENFCVWDVLALLVIVPLVLLACARCRRRSAPPRPCFLGVKRCIVCGW